MKKRFVVQRVRLVPESGRDWLNRPVEKTEEKTYLCKDGYTEMIYPAPYASRVETEKLWTTTLKEMRFFRTEELAEKTAFALVVGNCGVYMGHVSVVKVPGKKDLIKVRRRSPEKVNVGRWPNSSRRRKS